jgi:Na+/H+-dicarboxylate symporter
MTEIDTRLANRILLGLLIGAVAGVATLLIGGAAPAVLEGARKFTTFVLDPLGQVFLRMLFFVVIPLVFASLAMGVAQLERLGQLGPLAGRTFALFFLNMSIAVALGLIVMNVVGPGETLSPETRTRLMEEYGGTAAQHVERSAEQPDLTPMSVVEMFMPRNLFGAFVGNDPGKLGDVLPLILFAILVGAAAIRLGGERRDRLRSGLGLINDLMTGIVHFALKLAPYAVPALIYSVIIKMGWDIVVALGLFVVCCVSVMLLHLFGTMSIWVRLLAQRRLGEFWRQMRPVLATAFTTSSSAATLPAALAVAQEQLTGVRHRTQPGTADHAAVSLRTVRCRGSRNSGRLAAADRRPARLFRDSARRHRHHPRRRPDPRHDTDHGQRGFGYRHHDGCRPLYEAHGCQVMVSDCRVGQVDLSRPYPMSYCSKTLGF